ncbi:MAG: TolC family protein, partial [Telluria sp.]
MKNTMFKPVVHTALAAALATLVSACGTIGPSFKAPPGVEAPAYRHAQAAPQDQAARLPADWWTVFQDPALDSLEQRAMRDNPNVRAAAQRLVQAQAQLGVVRAGELPTVNLQVGVSNQRTSAETSTGLALGHRSIEGNNYTAGLGFSWELDLWGRVRRIVEASDAQALAAQDDRDGVLLLLSSQVATTYWQLRGLDAELAILRNALATRRESQELIEARFNAGLSNELDVSRTRIERANAEADLHEAQRQRNTLEHALSVLV